MKKHISVLLWTLVIAGWLVVLPTLARAGAVQADTCIRPAMPVISGSARTICRGDSVTLRATDCPGTVIWSTGQTGPQIGVRPQQTTRYTAICRSAQGCVSCYADVWKVTVDTPDAPVLRASAGLLCAGDALTITASGCAGTVVWSDGSTGSRLQDRPLVSTTYTAWCQGATCRSQAARPVSVQVGTPVTPTVRADQTDGCPGQPVQLRATGCAGTVRWSDGALGANRLVRPITTERYRALCQVGSCQSDSSEAVSIRIRPAAPLPVLATLQNDCPYQTVNLARALLDAPGGYVPGGTVEFRTEPLLAGRAVQSVGAVTAGTYYIFQRSADGCVRGPAAVQVRIVGCRDAISPCRSDPPGVALRLDSLNQQAGVVRLAGQLRGSAATARWQSNGTGLFTDTTLALARYVLSEQDRQRGDVTFALTTPDPDGSGPCVGNTASLRINFSAPTPLPVAGPGLSKQALEPVWVGPDAVRLTYRLTVKNGGSTNLRAVQVADNLEPVLLAAGAKIRDVAVRADSGWVVNPAYTGIGADTTLLLANYCDLPAGGEKHIWLTVTADVSQANTLTFSNVAFAQAQTMTGETRRDQSVNGAESDPDQNGDPTDNSEPTTLTVPAAGVAEAGSVFIPEGFSPNGDGVNDRFVIRGVPTGQTVSLTVYNRWGQAVFEQNPYRNEWDGTTGTATRQGLPDGTYFYVARLSDGREFARFVTLSR